MMSLVTHINDSKTYVCMSEVRKRVGAVINVVEQAYRYAEHEQLRIREGCTVDDMYGLINATGVLIDHLVHDGVGGIADQRLIQSVQRIISSRKEDLQTRVRDLDEVGQVNEQWYTRNREIVKEYFLGALRINRVINPEWGTQRFKRSLIGTGRYMQ